nr:uncharacterized protein LOC123747283 [Procambarus clarkii]
MVRVSNKKKALKARAVHASQVKKERKAALRENRVILSEDRGGLSARSVSQPRAPQHTLPRLTPSHSQGATPAAPAAPATQDLRPATPDVLPLDVAGPSTSRDIVETPNISTKRKGTQSSATKRIRLYKQQQIDNDGANESDSESDVKCRINPRESTIMWTDRRVEQYLDKHCVCKYCSMDNLRHTVTPMQHDVKLEKTCNNCNVSNTEYLMGNHENLTSLVYSNMINGHGYLYYTSMCAVNNMKFVSHNTYDKIQKKIRDAANERWVHLRESTRHNIFNHYKEQFNRHPSGGVLDIDVSFDGSWHTRGHHSQIGIAFVVEIFTGLVVDFNTFCKNCHKCQITKHRKQQGKITQAEFDDEMAKHLPYCDKNYDGTAKNMEADAAVLMWARSQDIKFRYTTVVSDGDSSAFNKVCAMNNGDGPYGDIKVEKAECINHFSKRLATQLRNFQETAVEIEETKGPIKNTRRMSLVKKGKGKLTDGTILKLAGYFTKAIRDNGNSDWKQMRDACLSGLFHATSTDEKPQHMHCPKGKDSWCFYQQDIANGKTTRSHKIMKVHFQLPSSHMTEVMKIYYNLVSEDNMTKCLKGKTQNPNESLHHRVWQLACKDKYVSRVMVDFAMAVTSVNYNAGYILGCLTNLLGLPQSDMRDWYFSMKEKNMQRQTRCTTKPRKAPEEADPGYGAGAY